MSFNHHSRPVQHDKSYRKPWRVFPEAWKNQENWMFNFTPKWWKSSLLHFSVKSQSASHPAFVDLMSTNGAQQVDLLWHPRVILSQNGEDPLNFSSFYWIVLKDFSRNRWRHFEFFSKVLRTSEDSMNTIALRLAREKTEILLRPCSGKLAFKIASF